MGREWLQRGSCAFLLVSEKQRELQRRKAEKPLKIKKEMLRETKDGQSVNVLQDQISHLLRIHIDWH